MKFIYRIVDEKGMIVAEDEDKMIVKLFLKWLKNYHGSDRNFKMYPLKLQQDWNNDN